VQPNSNSQAMDRLLRAIETADVPATQVVGEVDWSNMNEAMLGLGFDLMSIDEFCRLPKRDVVQGYHEGKLLLFRQMR